MYKDNETIADRLRKDDRSVIDDIYRLYHAKIFRFSIAYLKNEDDAYDIVQEVFIKIWENRFHLKEDTNFDAFLFSIAKNAVISLLRKRASKQKYMEHLSQKTNENTNKIEDDIDYDILRKQYYQLVDKLPPKRKEVFILSREKGMSNKEIAELKQIAEKTVEDHLTKSLNFLKQKFGNLGMFTALFFYLFID
jgi:RNA polymerase sigma-70 factor (family 1)